jgi:hypothetical protein
MSLCPHQARDIGTLLYHAEELGRSCRVTSEEVSKLGLTMMMPCDLSEADAALWKASYIRFLFREDLIEARCPACGHYATRAN